MAKTGVNAFDSLPSRIGFVDIDALRALYMNTQHPGFLEQFFSRVGLRPISKRLKEMREGSHRFAKKKLSEQCIMQIMQDAGKLDSGDLKVLQEMIP